MDIRKIKKLIELVQESDIAELEIKEGEESVRICRHSPVPMQAGAQTYLAPASSVAAAIATANVSNDSSTIDDSDIHKLLSPMVGTIYLNDKKTGKPLCAIDQQVQQGDVVCVIEAMTMMNSITADKNGIISALLIEDGDQIDFEQAILVIE